MEHPGFSQLSALAVTPEAMEQSIAYLAEHLSFLRKKEKVLICFAKDKPGSHGELFEQAVLRRGGVPVMVGSDWRWKTLLRLAFSNKITTIVAPPLVVLGVAKLARNNGIPLYIRNAVTAAYPCLEWMREGIVAGLDCDTWRCFGPRGGAVIAGFSCGKSPGVHLREDVYGISLVGEGGSEVPEGELGEMVLYSKADPSIRFPVGERSRLDRSGCKCGCAAPRLTDMQPGYITDLKLDALAIELLSWTSVLDCRLKKGESGLELEIVIFPGEKLPKLPTAAKQVVRPWDPEKDEPFFFVPGMW